MNKLCRICNNRDRCTNLVIVDRGLQKLVDVSIERNNGKEVFRSVTPIKVHEKLRRIYTRQSSILADGKQEFSVDAAAWTLVFSPLGKRRHDQVTFI